MSSTRHRAGLRFISSWGAKPQDSEFANARSEPAKAMDLGQQHKKNVAPVDLPETAAPAKGRRTRKTAVSIAPLHGSAIAASSKSLKPGATPPWSFTLTLV
jgi:hypothetical protein